MNGWLPGAFLRSSLVALVCLGVFVVTAKWTERPRVDYRATVEKEGAIDRFDTEERTIAVVPGPAGSPIYEPDLVGAQATAAAIALTAFLAVGFMLAVMLSPYVTPGRFDRAHWMALGLLLVQGAASLAAFLAAVYFAEILYWGTTLWVWPALLLGWLFGLILLLLGMPVAKENLRMESEEVQRNAVPGLYVVRQEAERLLAATEAVLAANGSSWRFDGCVLAPTFQPSVLLGESTVDGRIRRGTSLVLPAPLLMVTSREEWLAWLPVALERPAQLLAREEQRQQAVRARTGWWAWAARELESGGLAMFVLLPWRTAVTVYWLLRNATLEQPRPAEDPRLELTEPAAQAVLKAAFLEEAPFSPVEGSARWLADAAQGFRALPTRWQARLANEGSAATARLGQNRWVEQWRDTARFDFAPEETVAEWLDKWPDLDRRFSQQMMPDAWATPASRA